MFKAIIIFIVVIAVLFGGMLALRSRPSHRHCPARIPESGPRSARASRLPRMRPGANGRGW